MPVPYTRKLFCNYLNLLLLNIVEIFIHHKTSAFVLKAKDRPCLYIFSLLALHILAYQYIHIHTALKKKTPPKWGLSLTNLVVVATQKEVQLEAQHSKKHSTQE